MVKKELKAGMKFDSLEALCEYLEWPRYDGTHPDRLLKKMSRYFTSHKEGKRKRVIDEVFCDITEMKYPLKKKDGEYRYEIGQILNCHSGGIKILDRKMLSTRSNKRRAGYLCECQICGNTFNQFEYNLNNQIGCGVCDGKQFVAGINSFKDQYPGIAQLLAHPQEAEAFIPLKANRDFICPICGTIRKNVRVSNVVYRGLYCPCMRTRSVANRMMYWCLSNLSVKFESEKHFPWSDLDEARKVYDFYIPDISCIIEMNGAQHYIESTTFTGKSLHEIQNNDLQKKRIALQNGIKSYIEINCKNQTFGNIKKNIVDSELGNLIDLTIVDWKYVEKQTYMQMIKIVAEAWNSGKKDSLEIARILGFKTRAGALKYINKAAEYGYIEYDPMESTRTRIDEFARGNYYRLSKPLYCAELDLYFGNRSICAQEMTRITGQIFNGNSLHGDMKRYKGYTFCHIAKEEFNDAKKTKPERCFGDFFEESKR